MLRADSAFFSQDFQVPSQKRGWSRVPPVAEQPLAGFSTSHHTAEEPLTRATAAEEPLTRATAAEEPLARATAAEESVADARGEFANAHSPPVSEQRVKGHELR